MRKILLLLCFTATFFPVKAQLMGGLITFNKFREGYYYDNDGNKFSGLIDRDNSEKRSKKQEYILYKANKDSSKVKIPLSDIKAFVVEQDSFVVSKHYLGFYRVLVDNKIKLYSNTNYDDVSTYTGNGWNSSRNKFVTYFSGTDADVATEIDKNRFIDVLSEIMADKPEVVQKIKDKTYRLSSMEKLVVYYKTGQLPAAPKKFAKGVQ